MADTPRRPRKVGEYERPARTSTVGMVIGALVLIALVIVAILLFRGRGERSSALSHEGVRYAAIERGSGAGQGWLMGHSGARLSERTSGGDQYMYLLTCLVRGWGIRAEGLLAARARRAA